MYMGRRFIMLGALLGMLGVALGAFGTHTLGALLSANGRQSTYDTAVQYHLIHTLALLYVANLMRRWPGRLTRFAAVFFIVGIIVFSGSLYILSIFDMPIMGALAPAGGIALIMGWFFLLLTAWQNHVA